MWAASTRLAAHMDTRELPSGTVTFLFTDVEGSTELLERLGDAYAEALLEHRRVLRAAFASEDGVEVDTQGDAFFVAFATAKGAAAAALAGRRALAGGPIRVRMGIHTGEPVVTSEGYVGIDVHRGARVAASGHGGQILVSEQTRNLLGARDDLRDLGYHRLKDMGAPERIFQLGPGEFAPLKTLHQTNLPVQPTPFLGRAGELRDVGDLVRRDDVRLVTLTGPGGTGKTRLGTQAAAELVEEYPDGGVWFAGLASIGDSTLVLPTIAAELGVRDVASEGALDVLARHIGSKRMLLVIDNVEQVLPGAAQPLALLLAACPRLKLLVTSREALRVSAEHEYAVAPFSRDEAVALFVERAQSARRDFALGDGNREAVAEVCALLDDLPLAVELAAARVKLLSPHALLGRLGQRLPLLVGGARDAPERQRTLRGAIAWSHDLLPEDEQRLFARLAVFAGGFTLEAVEHACAGSIDELAALVDKSLVVCRDPDAAPPRYAMLETIREYALEQLDARGEDASCRQAHAIWAAEEAEEIEARIRREDESGLELMHAELHNVRAALVWSRAAGRGDLTTRIVGALAPSWLACIELREAKMWIEECLGHESDSPLALARILAPATLMQIYLGDLEAAERLCAAMPAPALLPESWQADALEVTAMLALASGRFADSVEIGLEAAGTARRAGETWLLRQILNNLGYAELWQGHIQAARHYLEEASRPPGGTWRAQGGRMVAISNLALLGAIEGDADSVAAALRELGPLLVEPAAEVSPPVLDAFLVAVAWLAADDGDADAALQAHLLALEYRDATGYASGESSPESSVEAAIIAFLEEACGAESWSTALAEIRRTGHARALDELIADVLATRTC